VASAQAGGPAGLAAAYLLRHRQAGAREQQRQAASNEADPRF